MPLTDEEIAGLSPQERLDLITRLWDSLEPDEVPVTAAQAAELHRRLATLDRDRANTISWDELQKRMEERRR